MGLAFSIGHGRHLSSHHGSVHCCVENIHANPQRGVNAHVVDAHNFTTCAWHMCASYSCIGPMTSSHVLKLWRIYWKISPWTIKFLSSERVVPDVIITFQYLPRVFQLCPRGHVTIWPEFAKSFLVFRIHLLPFHIVCCWYHFKIPHVSIQKWCTTLIVQWMHPQNDAAKFGSLYYLVSFFILFPTMYLA